MEMRDVEAAMEAILFAAGEPVSIARIAAVLAISPETVSDTAIIIADKLNFERRGIRLLKLENTLQFCSAPEYGDYVRSALETRKPPQLSQPALEVLAIAAYYQPVTRAYIEQVRGVDSSYTVGLLCDRGLLEPCGHLDAPGRPGLFRTTKTFLRIFGIQSLNELPELPAISDDGEDQLKIKSAVDFQTPHYAAVSVEKAAGE